MDQKRITIEYSPNPQVQSAIEGFKVMRNFLRFAFGVIVFLFSWASLASMYGIVGLVFGWIPCLFVAAVASYLWPIAIVVMLCVIVSQRGG